MPVTVVALLLIAFAWFCGSLPFGYWAGKFKGIDIRQHGSGNIGSTNVFRVLGKGIGIPVFILDLLKGLVPTLFATWYMQRIVTDQNIVSIVAVLSAAAAVLGHTFTFWLGGKGGKGVATSAGALIGLAPWALVIVLLVWAVVLITTRYVSLASILAAIALPIAMAVVMTWQHSWNAVLLGFGIVMGVLVVVRHRANITRILQGKESRMGSKKSKTS